eukprot:7808358-Pyramimonas_sp.AAC.1
MQFKVYAGFAEKAKVLGERIYPAELKKKQDAMLSAAVSLRDVYAKFGGMLPQHECDSMIALVNEAKAFTLSLAI